MSGVWSLASFPQRIGIDPNDSSDLRLQKSIPTAASLLVFARTRRHLPFLFMQLMLGLLVPLIHTLLLGGLWNSSAVVVWSLASPVGAMFFYPLRQARWWWLAYIVLIATAAALHPYAAHPNNLPDYLILAFFVFNVGSVSSICLLILGFFIDRKNEAYRLLHIEQEKSENLLLNMLPREIAMILKNEDRTIADSFESASILFTDLVGFTPLTAHMAPHEVVHLLNDIFTHFDQLAEKYDVEKIRTMGDNYMAAAGVPRRQPDHARRLACLALDMQAYIDELRARSGLALQFRTGINSGPVIGGVIGRKKFVYDIWGDVVNIASRMETQGVAARIQVTRATCDLIRDDFVCERRGLIDIKGRGIMETWFLVGAKADGGPVESRPDR